MKVLTATPTMKAREEKPYNTILSKKRVGCNNCLFHFNLNISLVKSIHLSKFRHDFTNQNINNLP